MNHFMMARLSQEWILINRSYDQLPYKSSDEQGDEQLSFILFIFTSNLFSTLFPSTTSRTQTSRY